MQPTVRQWAVVVAVVASGVGGARQAQGQGLSWAQATSYNWTAATCQQWVSGHAGLVMPCRAGEPNSVYRECQLNVGLARVAGVETVAFTSAHSPEDTEPVSVVLSFVGQGSHVVRGRGHGATFGHGGLKVRHKAVSTYWFAPTTPRYVWADTFVLPAESCEGRLCRTPYRQSGLVDKPAFVVGATVERLLAGGPVFDPVDTTTPREAFTAIRCVNAGCQLSEPCVENAAHSLWWFLVFPVSTLLCIRHRWAALACLAVLVLPWPSYAVQVRGPGGVSRPLESWQVVAQGRRGPTGECEQPSWHITAGSEDGDGTLEVPLLFDWQTCTLLSEEVRRGPAAVHSPDGGTAQGTELGCHRYVTGTIRTLLANPLTPALFSPYVPANDPLDAFYSFLELNEALWTIDQVSAGFSIYDDGLPAPHVCADFSYYGFGSASDLQRLFLGWNSPYQLNLFDPVGLSNPPPLPGGDCLVYQATGLQFDGSIFIVGQDPGIGHEHSITCVQHEAGFYLCEFLATGLGGTGPPQYINRGITIHGFGVPFYSRVMLTLETAHYTVLRVQDNGDIYETYCPPEWVQAPQGGS